jgi:hypothetical protein
VGRRSNHQRGLASRETLAEEPAGALPQERRVAAVQMNDVVAWLMPSIAT